MKILIAGGGTFAADLIEAVARPGNIEITHCTDETRALDELLSQEYDCAIISGQTLRKSKIDNIRRLRAMASENKRQAGPPAPPAPVRSRLRDGTSCGVEWTDNGILQLHCCLHNLLKPAGPPQKIELTDLGEIVFEYHAPCAKKRGRNG